MAFAKQEAKNALLGLLDTAHCFWINDPRDEASAQLKPLQLQMAQSVGLRIPRTVITTDPGEARQFIDALAGDTIYKHMSSATLYDESGRTTSPYTVKLTAEHINSLDHVAVTPCCFQENIIKAFELRVVVVGRFCQGARINSQEDPVGETDWRLAARLPWSPYEVPKHVQDQLFALLDALGLVFGAVDMIVTPDGQYVFLEVNPRGQWAFLPDDVTDAIRDAIAGLLASGGTASEFISCRAPKSAG
jgi:glutathione synthase/RimK-type ligase-like ATP-grasp enzyme